MIPWSNFKAHDLSNIVDAIQNNNPTAAGSYAGFVSVLFEMLAIVMVWQVTGKYNQAINFQNNQGQAITFGR